MLEFNSREEREQYVFELYKQVKTFREIAQIVHMSFSGTGAIIMKIMSQMKQKRRRNLYLIALKPSSYFHKANLL